MKEKYSRFLLAAIMAGCIVSGMPVESASAAAPSKVLDVNIVRPRLNYYPDVTYAQRYGWETSYLKMDVIKPDSQTKQPAILFVTGGAFIAAPKSNYLQQRVHLAEAGYVVASAEYRLVPKAKFPDPVIDIKAAVRYLRAHADEFGIDKDRIAIMGESAGGYMAAMVGSSNGVKDFDQGDNLQESSDVQAVVDLYGLSDLQKVGDDFPEAVKAMHKSPASTEAMLINGLPPFGQGGSIEEHPEAAEKANPAHYISAKSAPFLLMHGDKDNLVSPSQTEIMHTALREKGISSERYVVKNAGHDGIYWAQPDVEKVIISFLDRKLKK